jgi:hypothetical protein
LLKKDLFPSGTEFGLQVQSYSISCWHSYGLSRSVCVYTYVRFGICFGSVRFSWVGFCLSPPLSHHHHLHQYNHFYYHFHYNHNHYSVSVIETLASPMLPPPLSPQLPLPVISSITPPPPLYLPSFLLNPLSAIPSGHGEVQRHRERWRGKVSFLSLPTYLTY